MLRNGYPPEVSRYLREGRRRLIAVEALRPYVIRAKYDDGQAREYDLEKELTGRLSALRDLSVFGRVCVNDTRSIAWPAPGGEIDISADNVYIYGQKTE